jgi:hypothetical protein
MFFYQSLSEKTELKVQKVEKNYGKKTLKKKWHSSKTLTVRTFYFNGARKTEKNGNSFLLFLLTLAL